MARPAHPEFSRKGPLAAAIIVTFILCFLPRGVLTWLNGPRRIVEFVLIPVSDPALTVASWFRPPAPTPQNPRIAELQAEIDVYRKLLADAEKAVEDKQRLIEALQKGQAVGDGAFRQMPASVLAIKTTGAGGVIQISAGSKDGVELNSIATTNGVQLVGRVASVSPGSCKATLMTDMASGPIDGVITSDDGKRGASIRNISPQVGKRELLGRVEHTTPPMPEPKKGDTVRVDDAKNWPRSAQRLTIGTVTDVQTLSNGRIVVTVKPTVELERLREVVLILAPKSETPKGEAGAGGGGG